MNIEFGRNISLLYIRHIQTNTLYLFGHLREAAALHSPDCSGGDRKETKDWLGGFCWTGRRGPLLGQLRHSGNTIVTLIKVRLTQSFLQTTCTFILITDGDLARWERELDCSCHGQRLDCDCTPHSALLSEEILQLLTFYLHINIKRPRGDGEFALLGNSLQNFSVESAITFVSKCCWGCETMMTTILFGFQQWSSFDLLINVTNVKTDFKSHDIILEMLNLNSESS